MRKSKKEKGREMEGGRVRVCARVKVKESEREQREMEERECVSELG